MKKSRTVPKELKDKYEEISEVLREFCDDKLNKEYYELSCDLCAALARKRPSPLIKGRADTWACGIIHALGYVNFLFDPSQTPYMSPGELYESFGINPTTGQTRSKLIRDSLKMTQLDPEWTLPSRIDDNPMIWMILVNGVAMDARTAPIEIQEAAYRQGVIPYIPGKQEKELPTSNVIPFPTKKKTPSRRSGRDNLSEAQNLISMAYDTEDSKKRIEYAKQALKFSENCAEAYIILAQEASECIEDARAYYEKAMEAARKVIGEKTFEEDEGHFWGIWETRPYMRAKWYLAEILWHTKERKAAIQHLKDLLRLNVSDNQGIRYIIIYWLLQQGGEDDYVEKIFKDYEDDGAAALVYGKALFYFKKGNNSEALKYLKAALKTNPHVPKYLLGKKRVPRNAPEYIGYGDETEAQAYYTDSYEAWKSIKGSLEWLKNNCK